jgi:predicted esterase
MVQAEWARATLYRHDNPARARETLGYVRSMLEGLADDDAVAARWATYAAGERPLFFAHLSRRDGTLQWYAVTLPDGWDGQRSRDEQAAFPLFVELHGAGNAHPLNHAAAFLRAAPKAADLSGYSTPRTYAQIDRAGYHVFPFGRGNSGYRDIGETDVWEAIADAERTFKVDEDRRYLYGFSMGGSGTWNLGVRTPDRWAAIAILGMGPNTMPEIGLARNVATLPLYFWAGEDDRGVFRGERPPTEQIAAFAAELRKHGGSPVVNSTPGVGHNYLGEKQKEAHEFLKSHVRKRPDTFAFVSDTPEHRGAWGVVMTRDPSMSGAPSFTCAVDGQTVRIDSEGTPGLTVDLGPDGLRMSGTVTILWNGQSAYEGPVNDPDRPVRLGSVPERRRR